MSSADLDVRSDPSVMDGPWMTRVLEQAGVARGATVDTVEFDSFIGTGQMARSARLKLHWNDAEGRPASVVAKMTSDDATARNTGFDNGSYETEWAYYSRLNDTLNVRTPHCYAALFDHNKPDFVLVLEDLKDSRQGDQLAGLSVDQCDLALGQAVGFHAPRWGDPSLPEFAPHKPPPETATETLTPIYLWALDLFLARLGDRLDDDVIQLTRDLAPLMDAWITGTDLPSTVIHMDFRADNLLFGVTGDAPPVAVVDWQTVTVGSALWDVAYLLGAGLNPDERARSEKDLLKEYLARMGSAGVSLDFDSAWQAYRIGAIWGVVMAVVATPLAQETDRGNDMLTQMAQGHGRHAIDLESLSLLC